MHACVRALIVQKTLNDFMAAGRPVWKDVRARVQALFAAPEAAGADDRLRASDELRAAALLPAERVSMVLPAHIGDYTDFYSSREHATNVGIMFRGAANALQPNWCVTIPLPSGCCARVLRVLCWRGARPATRVCVRANSRTHARVHVCAPRHVAARPRALAQAALAGGLPRPLQLSGGGWHGLQAPVRPAGCDRRGWHAKLHVRPIQGARL